MKLHFVFAVLCMLFAAIFAAEDVPANTELTQENWNEMMDLPDTVWVVTFHVPWCPYCKKWMPEHHKASTSPTLSKGSGQNFRFGTVDASQASQLVKIYGIKNVPAIKIFFEKDGHWFMDDYTGKRKASKLVKYLNDFYIKNMLPFSELVQDGKIVYLNDKNIDKVFADKKDDIWMVKFGAPWCKHCVTMKKDWAKAAEQLGGKVRFADIDVSQNKEIAKRFDIKYLPEIKYFKGSIETGSEVSAKDFSKFSGGRKADEIIKFARELLAVQEAEKAAKLAAIKKAVKDEVIDEEEGEKAKDAVEAEAEAEKEAVKEEAAAEVEDAVAEEAEAESSDDDKDQKVIKIKSSKPEVVKKAAEKVKKQEVEKAEEVEEEEDEEEEE